MAVALFVNGPKILCSLKDDLAGMLSLPVLIDCEERLQGRAWYALDSLFMAAQIAPVPVEEPPGRGPWLLYSSKIRRGIANRQCVRIPHSPAAWEFSAGQQPTIGGHALDDADHETDVTFDLVASAFYFLASLGERHITPQPGARGLYRDSVFARCSLPQTIVDDYLQILLARLDTVLARSNHAPRALPRWPGDKRFAVVLSHDVDFLAEGRAETFAQAGRTAMRHLVRQHAPLDAARGLLKFAKALMRGRDPFCDIPGIIAREKQLGVRSSFQVAVGHRDPADVNYYIERDSIRRSLSHIRDEGFEVALHGSVRSTEQIEWYAEEATKLAKYLAVPIGSRQHFLSFDYEELFEAQERAGIQFDMSMGYPDRTGPRAGFSFPYFPYSLTRDRPYNVVEIGLTLMDVTLRGYMKLDCRSAWPEIERQIDHLRSVGGCASVVWHPIVFGGARDPGMDDLFWKMIEKIKATNGTATDGRSINAHVRERARLYPSFSGFAG